METNAFIIRGVPIQQRSLPRLPRNTHLQGYSYENRKGNNLAEVAFWKQVHKKKFHGIDFTRQFIIGNYIADFYVRKLGLVVEVDGGSHIGREEYDRRRDEYMRSLGIQIFRVSDYDVLHHTKVVMRRLEGFILENFADDDCG